MHISSTSTPSHLWSRIPSTPSTPSGSHSPYQLFQSPAATSTSQHPSPISSPSPSLAFWGPSTPRRYNKPTETLGPTPIRSPRSSQGLYSPPRGLGYFAFPPGGPIETSPEEEPLPRPEPLIREDEDAERERLRQAEEAAQKEEAAEKARTEREAEARRGEEAWVRSGGILRDAQGMRDMTRTDAVRAELRLRDWEEGARARWEVYERGWRTLLAGDAEGRAVRFGDIPWPVGKEGGEDKKTRMELEDLTASRVEEFVLEGLRVRGCKVTRKERVRSSLLRWHPDKMTAVLARVTEEDVEKVRAGIRVVTECLQGLNARA